MSLMGLVFLSICILLDAIAVELSGLLLLRGFQLKFHVINLLVFFFSLFF